MIFLSFGQSCWKSIFKRPRWKAFLRCMACRIPAKKSCSSHLFSSGPKLFCSDSVRAGIIESHNFFVLVPTLVKFHIRVGPAVFRGRLRAFGKCTNGVAVWAKFG